MIQIQSNQYCPRRGPMVSTYWFFTDKNGKVLDKKTFKPYRGRVMERFGMKSEEEARTILKNKFGQTIDIG